jgi:hypothetical protein
VVRDRLGLKPGDTLRYRLTDAGVLLGKAAFTEWSGEADEKAYGDRPASDTRDI